MQEKIKEFFKSENIEYFCVLDYNFVREINKGLAERAGFSPRSVIMYLLPYYTGEVENLSRYAASLDYHIAVRDIGGRLSLLLSELFPGSSSRAFGDHSPIDERHAALIGGLGILGDNGLIINEKYGSYVFVADVISDIAPEALGASLPHSPKRCEQCGICKRSCPTGILSGCGTDCLSAITQRKGELSKNEVEIMRKVNTVWGCDECQAHCPHNQNPVVTPIEFFHKERISRLDSEILSSMSKAEFERRAFAWRGRKTVERNLEILKNS